MSDAIQSLRERLDTAEGNLRLIQERKAEYVLKTDVPLQLIKDEQRLETQIADLRLRLARLAEIACPYRGLEPFEVEHAAFYFGRGAMVDRLVAKVGEVPFVAVVGPSGCGKSSLVRAGLVTALCRGALPGSQDWAIRIFRPGRDPLRALAVPLVALLEPEASEVDRLAEARKLADHLRKGTLSMDDVATDLHEVHPDFPCLLLVVDQFEEVYTECDDEASRQAFVHTLVAAAEVAWVRVVLTLRADFFGRVLGDRDLGERVDGGLVNVLPMSEEELRAAIEKPALKTGRGFDPGLVERILEDVAGEPGNLPLLEFALEALWAEQTAEGVLTHGAYEAIGEVQGAVARRAEAVYGDLEKRGQGEVVQRVLLRLTHYGEGVEGTRRRATLDDLVTTRTPRAAVAQVGGALADARLLVTGQDEAAEAATFEVAHEALIRGWERLRRWLDEDRGFGLWRERLAMERRTWEETKPDEGALLRGAPLAEAEGWLAGRGDDLNEAERAFIEESVALRERERGARERRRRGITLGLVAGLVVTLVLTLLACMLAGIAGVQSWRSEQRRREAEEQRRIALARQLAAQARNYFDDQLDLALLLGVEANRTADTVEGRGSLLDGLAYNPHLSTFLRGHTDWVSSVAFSPDGHTLASSGCAKYDDECCVQGEIYLWDTATNRPLGQPLTGHSGLVYSVAFSPDGQLLASASSDQTVILWDVATGQPAAEPLTGHTGGLSSVVFSPDGQTLASAGDDGSVILWDVATGRPTGEPLKGHTSTVFSLAFSPDGQTLASGGCAEFEEGMGCTQGEIILWDVADRQPIGGPLTGHGGQVWSLAFSPDGQMLASGSCSEQILGAKCLGGEVLLWDVETRQPLGGPLTDHTDWVYSVAFSPDGQTLASGSRDDTVILWDVATVSTDEPIGQPLIGHTDGVLSVAFSPDGQTLASGSDRRVILWNVVTRPPLVQRIIEDAESLRHVTFSPDGQTLASSDQHTAVRLWDVATGQPAGQPFTPVRDEVTQMWEGSGGSRVAYSPDGETLALVCPDDTIMLWDVATGQPVGSPLVGHTGFVNSVVFSPDGRVLASGSDDGTVMLWDVATGEPAGQPLTGHTRSVYSVAFSPDGQTLASGSGDNTIILWDIAAGTFISHPLSAHTGGVVSLAFSPDGQVLASGSEDGTVILWDVASGEPVGDPFPTGHVDRDVGGVWGVAVAFSPDGRTLASGGCGRFYRGLICEQGEIRLWDVATGQAIGQPITIDGIDQVWSVAFRPDGQTLAAALGETIILWDVGLEAWEARACRVANRNLTPEEWRQYLGDEPYRPTCPDLAVPGD